VNSPEAPGYSIKESVTSAIGYRLSAPAPVRGFRDDRRGCSGETLATRCANVATRDLEWRQ